jgi:hypothetical protein
MAAIPSTRPNGKKRYVLGDRQGLMFCAAVQAADILDRDGGVMLMATLFGLFRLLLTLHADSGHHGPKFQEGPDHFCDEINVEIVKHWDIGNFVVLPKR